MFQIKSKYKEVPRIARTKGGSIGKADFERAMRSRL